MVIECDIDTQWASEVKYIHDLVFHKFTVASDTLEEAQQKVESYIDYLWSLYEQPKKILDKITYAEWYALLDALKKCVEDYYTYLGLINTGMVAFQNLLILSAGNVDELFLEITDNVIEIFISVRTGTEDHLKEFQEIMEKLKSPSPMDES